MGQKRKLAKSLVNTLLKKPKVQLLQPSGKSTKCTELKTDVAHVAIPFSYTDNILLVGEGNFSFAKSLHGKLLEQSCLDDGGAFAVLKLVATSYDSKEVCFEKYPDAEENVNYLINKGVNVMFEIDATKLQSYEQLGDMLFHKIVFNFPHVGLGIKDQRRNAIANQKLLLDFFKSSAPLLFSDSATSSNIQTLAGLSKPYEATRLACICVSLKSGLPYSQWEIKKVANLAGLKTILTASFVPQAYPGYVHRRTLGFNEKLSKDDNIELVGKSCKMYIFKPLS